MRYRYLKPLRDQPTESRLYVVQQTAFDLPMEATIAAHVSASLNNFRNLLAVVEVHDSLQDGLNEERDSRLSQLSRQVIQNEFSRFKVWAGNIGAHRSGRTSLDYRLRDSSNIRGQAANLLQDLSESLNDATAIYRGERVPWDQETPDQHDLDGYEEDEELMSGLAAPTGLTELSQISSDITEVINCLFRLTVSIQNPAPHDRFKRRNWVDTSYFEERDIAHVRDMFPSCTRVDSERLGKAISRRRQYFKYREIHHQKMAHGLDGAGDDDDGAQSTVASSIPKHLKNRDSTNTQPQQPLLDEDNVSVSAWTDTTFGDSLITGDRPRIPALPATASDGSFECPFCYMLISVTTSRGWAKHVLADLRPYICLSPDCAMSKTDYEGRHEWMQHVLGNHWRSWNCVYCADQFDSAIELRTHFVEVHPEAGLQQGVEVMVKTGEKPKALNTPSKCPFCQQHIASAKEYSRHVGRHQRDLALFALPNIQSDSLVEHTTDSDSDDADEVLPKNSPPLPPLRPTLRSPSPFSFDDKQPRPTLGDGTLISYLDGHRLEDPASESGDDSDKVQLHDSVKALELITSDDLQTLEDGAHLPGPASDLDTNQQFALLMEKAGWNSLPEEAKRQMLAYPADKKLSLLEQAHRASLRHRELAPDATGKKIPLDATWTKIPRSLVSVEVLERAGVRYEARPTSVAVLGKLTAEQIDEFARQTIEVRNSRAGMCHP
ncbi:hypothetical protein B0T21DRAFT_94707 [Apiosordaria backusii]|uniref:C2H2-type domain-containing protein n=1 Tax=Apiosordaria backusii TaxID=314023 RepID=A0AA40ESU0_9PEZI|nr:hypothetical protein B0T21DRAFT_94707 [Apiosordaria backusii]